MLTISREPLRNPVREQILDRIINGQITPGARLSLAALARDFRVSATPIREALTQLAREGFVREEANRGFFAIELSMREAREIYPLIWTLEGLALRLQGPLPPERIAELRAINDKLGARRIAPGRLLQLDRRWHDTLIEQCDSTMLHEHVAGLKQRANRFEYAYMKHSGRLPDSTKTHEDITQALERGETECAVTLLEGNWRTSLDFLSDWLQRTDD